VRLNSLIISILLGSMFTMNGCAKNSV